MARRDNATGADAGGSDAALGPGKRRGRRPAGAVREALLKSAREVFERRGYAGATTREIAREAATSEVLLFRYFESKAKLFEEAIVKPFEALIEELIGTLNSRTATIAPIEESRNYVSELVHQASAHRGLLFALITASAYDLDVRENPGFERYFEDAMQMVQLVRGEPEDSNRTNLKVRYAFATIIGTLLLEEWIIPPKLRGSDEDRAILADFVFTGLMNKPSP